MPSVLTYVPGAQLVQELQLGEFTVVLNVLAGHAEHVRSATVDPAPTSYCPGVQLVFAKQALAELKS